MGKTINDWLSRPLYIYSFGLFFLVYKSSQYFGSFDPLLFMAFFGGYCLINYCLIWVLKKIGIYKYGICWLIPIWTLILFPELMALPVSQLLDHSFVRVRYLLIFIILLCLLISLIRKRLTDKNVLKVNSILNVFIVIFTVVTFFDGIQAKLHENAHSINLKNRILPSVSIKNNNDIIWILLDEYASPASLRSQFHFHDPLVDSLKENGFLVYDALHSRSDVTVRSVNALFNLDDSTSISNHNYVTDYLNKSVWVKHLEKVGYSFINLDFFNIGSHSKFSYLRIFSDNYIDQVISESMFVIFLSKFSKEEMPFDNYNQKIIEAFKLKVREKHTKPVFIWTHLLIPHEPFFRNADGTLNKSPVSDVIAASPSEISSQYIGYLNYGNKVVLEMLNEIPDWKNKTIIISGDHGARMLIPDNDPRRKQTFGAIYYPGMDQKELSKIKYMQQIPFHLH